MGAANRRQESLISVLLLLLICSCGGEGGGAATAPETPAPVVEATPEPTAEPTPLALAPTMLLHVVIDETVGAPELPSRSPLARDLRPLPEGDPTAEALEADAAPLAVVEALRSLEAGYGTPEGVVALVQWNLRWGPDGAAGSARRWGLCSVPCTVVDAFVATPANHPVHPVIAPRALFAMRPGVQDLSIRRDGGDIEVVHGEARLWLAGQAADPITASREDVWPVMDARGLLTGEATTTSQRTLQVLSVDSRIVPLSGTSDPLPSETRVLPRLGVSPSPVGRLAVEGVEELWSWPAGSTFEGGFSARPNPDNDGLKLDRIQQEIRWRPTVRQAGDGRMDFPPYSLVGASKRLTVHPFPEGAAVLGGTPAVDGRVVVGAGTDFEPERRARQVADMLEHYAELLPMPEVPAPEVVAAPGASRDTPWVVYSAADAVDVVPGSAGSRAHALVVDDDLDERASVARAWARLQLAPRIDSRSVAALDFLDWAMSKLDEERTDGSTFTHVFVAAGDDVEQVWREWLTDPDKEGPAPGAFLSFVESQLPDLAEELRRSLAARSVAVAGLPEPLELEAGASSLSMALEDPGPAGAVVTVSLPEGAGLEPVQVEMTPGRSGPAVHWAAVLVDERTWQEAGADPVLRAAITEGLSATRGIVTEEVEEEPATPAAAPSQLQGQYGAARVRPRVKPKQAEPVVLALQHEGQPVGRSVVLLTAWGAPGWAAHMSITSAVPMPEPVAEAAPTGPAASHDEPVPEGSPAPHDGPGHDAEPQVPAE